MISTSSILDNLLSHVHTKETTFELEILPFLPRLLYFDAIMLSALLCRTSDYARQACHFVKILKYK